MLRRLLFTVLFEIIVAACGHGSLLTAPPPPPACDALTCTLPDVSSPAAPDASADTLPDIFVPPDGCTWRAGVETTLASPDQEQFVSSVAETNTGVLVGDNTGSRASDPTQPNIQRLAWDGTVQATQALPLVSAFGVNPSVLVAWSSTHAGALVQGSSPPLAVFYALDTLGDPTAAPRPIASPMLMNDDDLQTTPMGFSLLSSLLPGPATVAMQSLDAAGGLIGSPRALFGLSDAYFFTYREFGRAMADDGSFVLASAAAPSGVIAGRYASDGSVISAALPIGSSMGIAHWLAFAPVPTGLSVAWMAQPTDAADALITLAQLQPDGLPIGSSVLPIRQVCHVCGLGIAYAAGELFVAWINGDFASGNALLVQRFNLAGVPDGPVISAANFGAGGDLHLVATPTGVLAVFDAGSGTSSSDWLGHAVPISCQ